MIGLYFASYRIIRSDLKARQVASGAARLKPGPSPKVAGANVQAQAGRINFMIIKSWGMREKTRCKLVRKKINKSIKRKGLNCF